MDSGTLIKESESSSKKICSFSDGGYAFDLCPLLEKKAHCEKIDFLRQPKHSTQSGVCFGCVCIGHIIKDCRKRLTCMQGMQSKASQHSAHLPKRVGRISRTSKTAIGGSGVQCHDFCSNQRSYWSR